MLADSCSSANTLAHNAGTPCLEVPSIKQTSHDEIDSVTRVDEATCVCICFFFQPNAFEDKGKKYITLKQLEWEVCEDVRRFPRMLPKSFSVPIFKG